MAYIKERGNNNYFVRVTYGKLDNGRPFQKSRLFRPSRIDLPKTKLRKELDAFVAMLEEECRLESHHRRVLRRLRLSATKVSLSSAYVMASLRVLLGFPHISFIARSLRSWRTYEDACSRYSRAFRR